MTELPGKDWPKVRTVGFDGFLVSFADKLSEPANRAALALRDAIQKADWDGVEESSTSLVSAYLRFDPLTRPHQEMQAALEGLINKRDWFSAKLPDGRKLWRVPTVFGGDTGPQLEEAAAAAGLSPEDAIASISQNQVRVQTIGFAPGMPYLGELLPEWDIPRQSGLTDQVMAGGLCVALRQLVLFPVATPTGWRHIGQTHFRLFRPEADAPFVLRPGDEVQFQPVSPENLQSFAEGPNGGATSESIS